MNEMMTVVSQICEEIAKKVSREDVADAARRRQIPEKLWQMWAETGLLGVGVPEDYGGAGGGCAEVTLAIDLLHRKGLELPNAVPNHMSRTAIIAHGSEEQKQRFLPATTTGEKRFAFAITEPEAGTNSFKIRTSARKQDDGSYKLSGQKHFITAWDDSDYAMVVARTSAPGEGDRTSGLSLFVVDTKAPGTSSTLMDIAIHLPDRNYVVNFDDVTVPAENLIGTEGKGLEAMFDSLNPERIFAAAMCVGLAEHVLFRAVEFAKERAPFDAPIGSYQAIQHPMAIALARIEAARNMLHAAAAKYDEGGSVGLEANMAKFLASDALREAASIAMTTFGGSCTDLSQDILPFFLRSKLVEVAPVNNFMVLSFIAQKGLGLPKSY